MLRYAKLNQNLL